MDALKQASADVSRLSHLVEELEYEMSVGGHVSLAHYRKVCSLLETAENRVRELSDGV